MPFIDYTDNGDGSLTFHDDMGTSTPPMAGPAALQQKNKIDASRIAGGPLADNGPVPIIKPIRGERAELSPEMLEAGGMGPDLRTAGIGDAQIERMLQTKAPNGSIVDAGGAPRAMPRSVSDAGLEVPGFKNVVVDPETGAMYRRPPSAPPPAMPSKPTDAATQKFVDAVAEKGGVPKTVQDEPKADGKVVPEGERVQISLPARDGLRFAPAAPVGAGGVSKPVEMKAGETYGYTSIDPENVANIKRADQNRYLAAEQLGEAQARGGANATGVLAEVPQGLTELERERQMQEESIAQRIQQDHERLDSLRNEARQDVDPHAFWKNKSAAERFMGALAMGIGAYVQTMTGGQNTPMQVLNGAIKDEIDAQNSNRNAAHQRFQDMRGQMAERRQLFQDERQNFLGKKVAYLEQAQAKLATYAQDAKTEEQKAQVADMQARIQRESEMTLAEFGKVSHQVQTKVVQTGGPATRGTGISELDHEKYVPQFGGLAPTKEEAVLARQKGAAIDTMRRLVSENVRLRDQPDAFIPGTEKHAQLKSNQAKMILTLKRKENEDLGVIAGPDMDLMLGAIGDGTSITPGQTAAMKNFLSNENRVNENIRRNIGLIPVETAPIRDEKTGEIRIGQMVTGNIVTPRNVSGRYDQPVQSVHIAKTNRQEKK